MSKKQMHRKGRGVPRIAMPHEKPKDLRGTLKRLAGYLKPRKYSIAICLLLSIAGALFGIVSPKIMGLATTELFDVFKARLAGNADAMVNFEYIAKILLSLTALYVVSSLFTYIMSYIMAGISQKTVYDIRKDVNEKIARLPLKYLDSHTHGEILSRVTNDVDNISSSLQESIIQIIMSVITLVGVVIMMLSINVILTLAIVLTLSSCIFLTKKVAKRSRKYFTEQQKIIGKINSHVEEMYTGHKIVKSFGYENKSIEEFQRLNEDLNKVGWKAQFISGIIMPLMRFVNNLGYVVVCIGGGMLMIKNAIKLGDIQAFLQYLRKFSQPIMQVSNIINIIQSTIASAERVFEVLDEEEEIPDKKDCITIEDVKGEVAFKNVRFGYKEDNILIKNMNIDVKSGQTVAIVGPTGAGKTTLVNLLMRFYDINDGSITIDGANIKDLKRGELRNIFGMVLQDTWLFSGTIKDNIAYGKQNVTDEEIYNAAKTAHAHHFIRTLSKGYETVLNEDANNISQGQKQLLTIARAVLADPAILILDEATSSVDTRTEVYIQNAMNELMKGRTCFVIAHRLSTIKEADVILVMNEGDIIESGTHKELIEKKGFYEDLYNSQFSHEDIKEVV
ncbi:ABC transporter ATP-binding protein [Clostridiaceae bacterium M8S5]|nr:ABC transporter ATP-binding protein [Clostridiaceae bacterium M8S5]